MDLPKYIRLLFKPSVKRRAKAMKREKKARSKAVLDAENAAFSQLEKSLGYKFSDRAILKESLTHPGAVGFSKGKIKSNQRLEFLGDAILQSIITDSVFRKFDELDEGDLTKIRIALTQGIFLGELSEHIGIPHFLILPKGCESLRNSSNAAEDAFEAVVGAIYMDSNFEKTRDVVLSWYKRKLDELPDLVSQQNPKGALQELAAKHADKIVYTLLGQSGPDHSKVFEVEVSIGGRTYAKASASSKKAAEIKAAKLSIKQYAADCAEREAAADKPHGAEGKAERAEAKNKAERAEAKNKPERGKSENSRESEETADKPESGGAHNVADGAASKTSGESASGAADKARESAAGGK